MFLEYAYKLAFFCIVVATNKVLSPTTFCFLVNDYFTDLSILGGQVVEYNYVDLLSYLLSFDATLFFYSSTIETLIYFLTYGLYLIVVMKSYFVDEYLSCKQIKSLSNNWEVD